MIVIKQESLFAYQDQRQTMLTKKQILQKVIENAMIELQFSSFPNFWKLVKIIFSGVFLCVLRSGLVPCT